MPKPVTLTIPADFAYLHIAGAAVAALLEHDPEDVAYNVQLALQEACTNIVRHAYAGQPDGLITITMTRHPQRLTVELTDTGTCFDPSTVDPPDLDQPQEGGYGLFLMYTLMDDISYHPEAAGNTWRLTKLLGDTP
jgi:anti-sigma regulatory factor (Ser/Thr protein kinase)